MANPIDLSQFQQQQPQVQPAPQIPQGIFESSQVQVQPIQVPGGAGWVGFFVVTSRGLFCFGCPAREAIDLGRQIMAQGRVAMTGLSVIGDPTPVEDIEE